MRVWPCLPFPQGEAGLLRHYTLSDEDLQNIGARRRPRRRKLGFALQLCVLRYPGRRASSTWMGTNSPTTRCGPRPAARASCRTAPPVGSPVLLRRRGARARRPAPRRTRHGRSRTRIWCTGSSTLCRRTTNHPAGHDDDRAALRRRVVDAERRIEGRRGDTRTGGLGRPMARRTVLTSNFNRRAISLFFGTPFRRRRNLW